MALVPVAKGENLPFESACQAFEELCKPTNDRHHRENVVRRLWSNFGIEEHASFPLMRLMLPHLDTSSRPNYKLKQKGLAALYVDMMGLDPNSTAAQTMTNWKRPSTGFQKSEQGNFPEVMYEVIKPRCKPRADLPRRVTIGEVNALLDRLAREQEKLPPMREIHTRCTALEQKWIFRIITKDLGIGMKEDKVFKLLHPDAQELYNSVCDLSATCEKCADPEYRLESISLELFKPVRPRLAARANWRSVDKEMSKKGEYVAEYKLDGERMIMHLERSAQYGGEEKGLSERGHSYFDGGVRTEWWSRNAKNATSWYGEAMSPIIARCVPASVESLVLDGELMVWDRDTGDFSPFGENRSMAAGWRKVLEGNKQPCYVVFDVLWINGRNVTQRTLAERRRELISALNWETHSFELAKQELVKGGTQEMMHWLDQAMMHGYEGVMLKSLASSYMPGSRDNDWQKLKPDYVDEMGEELDLLIVAGYYGDGKKRGGAISHFLMGLRAPEAERQRMRYTGPHPMFYPFCKVGTGYTVSRLAHLREELRPGQEKYHKHDPPPHLCGWKENKTDDLPDVWFHPDKSKIMSVKAYEITTTEAFLPCGLTLRFPRSTQIRNDKNWDEAEKFQRVKNIFDEFNGRLASHKRRAEEVARNDTSDVAGKRGGRKGGPPKRPRLQTAVPSHLGLASGLTKVAAEHDAFAADEAGLRPQVVAITFEGQGTVSGEQGDVQRQIKLGGGDLRTGDPTRLKEVSHLVVVGRPDIRIKNYLRDAPPEGYDFDIVDRQWVADCHEAQCRLPLEPRYVLLAKRTTREQMELTMDRWGDRYETLADETSLSYAMQLVRDERAKPRGAAVGGAGDSSQEAVDAMSVDEQLRGLAHGEQLALCTSLSSLRGVVAFAPRVAVRLRLRLLGADVVDALAAHVTHAVLPAGALGDGTAEKLLQQLRELRLPLLQQHGEEHFQTRLVTEGWLAACEEEGGKADLKPHLLRLPANAHAYVGP